MDYGKSFLLQARCEGSTRATECREQNAPPCVYAHAGAFSFALRRELADLGVSLLNFFTIAPFSPPSGGTSMDNTQVTWTQKPRTLQCYAGLDLVSTTDITALVLVFPPRDETEPYVVVPHFWIPEDNIELRVNRDHVPYDEWEREGLLPTTEGNVVHYAAIEAFIEELGTRYDIREIAYDRWGAVQMSQNLEDAGFTVIPFGQGFRDMSPPSKELMKLAFEGRLAHGGHPVLAWMVDNIHVRTDPAGNIKPDKQRSTEKIDGVVATIMALDRAIRGGNASSGGSVYDRRGLLVL